ncbi:hypothetical protein IGI04_002556 [Brassica rapa subsp. trilocularis]|uniref:Uncharacterized protein n=1 Tax=Brassica rapa subsp. trilocularis TaxID=1813537 RepID=A0ABQ7NZ68_BRACM|nr:hypothetical protein IGI04_002556 [Brassica rapa subsp. trilocularis]
MSELQSCAPSSRKYLSLPLQFLKPAFPASVTQPSSLFVLFMKNSEFMGITVLFLDENINFVIHGFIPAKHANHYIPSLKASSIVKVVRFEVARCSHTVRQFPSDCEHKPRPPRCGCTNPLCPGPSPKKQLESLSVSSLTHKKQSTHNSLHIFVYIVLTSMIKNISYPKSVVVYLSLLLIKLKNKHMHTKRYKRIPTYTNAVTTSPPAHSFCFMKIAYMPCNYLLMRNT